MSIFQQKPGPKMAALVTGLIPILRTAVETTTTYKFRSMWFGMLCIRLVILFLAELPFTKLDADFSCNSTSKDVCTSACFNRHFHKPMMMAWNYLYILVVISALLMELLTSHLRSAALKKSGKSAAGVEGAELQAEATATTATDGRGRMVLDFHRQRGVVGFYVLSIALRIVVEAWFMYILLFWNLPALNSSAYECSTDLCPQLRLCVVRAAPEKRMSIYALASISGMVIVISLLFCLYAIAHYLCNF